MTGKSWFRTCLLIVAIFAIAAVGELGDKGYMYMMDQLCKPAYAGQSQPLPIQKLDGKSYILVQEGQHKLWLGKDSSIMELALKYEVTKNGDHILHLYLQQDDVCPQLVVEWQVNALSKPDMDKVYGQLREHAAQTMQDMLDKGIVLHIKVSQVKQGIIVLLTELDIKGCKKPKSVKPKESNGKLKDEQPKPKEDKPAPIRQQQLVETRLSI